MYVVVISDTLVLFYVLEDVVSPYDVFNPKYLFKGFALQQLSEGSEKIRALFVFGIRPFVLCPTYCMVTGTVIVKCVFCSKHAVFR